VKPRFVVRRSGSAEDEMVAAQANSNIFKNKYLGAAYTLLPSN